MNVATAEVSCGAVSSVLIVDDHPLYSDALAGALDRVFPGCDVAKVGTLRHALERLDRGFTPDLVMFDLKLPDVSGLSGFLSLRDRVPDTPVLVISSLAAPELIRALMNDGAAGFMRKDSSADDLRGALLDIASGQKYLPEDVRQILGSAEDTPAPEDLHPRLSGLTPQQKRVLKLICAGKPNKQIAFELSLAEATVKAHITALLRRLGVRNRTQAAVLVESAVIDADMGPGEPEARAFLIR